MVGIFAAPSRISGFPCLSLSLSLSIDRRRRWGARAAVERNYGGQRGMVTGSHNRSELVVIRPRPCAE